MLWITVAIIGYFFNALANILDKYILSAKIPKPSVYAFFVAIFSTFALLAAPFGLRVLSASLLAISFISGAFFVYGLVFFYRAVRENDISRVAPLMGVFMALGALLYTFVLQVMAGDWTTLTFSGHTETLLAFWLLLSGGFLITFDLPLRTRDIFRDVKDTAIASAFLVVSLIMLKYVYSLEGFVNGFVWSRMGLLFGGLSLLFVPTFRQEIRESFYETSRHAKGRMKSGRDQASIGLWFLTNKIIGSLGNILVQYAIFLGPLVVVQALSGVQFAFVFLLVIPLSYRLPAFFQEKLYFNDWFQKVIALILIGLGIYVSAMSGVKLFL
jgi:hypothetical protein